MQAARVGQFWRGVAERSNGWIWCYVTRLVSKRWPTCADWRREKRRENRELPLRQDNGARLAVALAPDPLTSAGGAPAVHSFWAWPMRTQPKREHASSQKRFASSLSKEATVTTMNVCPCLLSTCTAILGGRDMPMPMRDPRGGRSICEQKLTARSSPLSTRSAVERNAGSVISSGCAAASATMLHSQHTTA